MILHNRLWKIREPSSELVEKLIVEYRLNPIIAKLLVNRGISSIEKAKEFIDNRSYYLDDSSKTQDEKCSTIINIDCQLNIKDITFNLIEEMEQLGLNRPNPKFLYKDITIKKFSLVGEKKNILKLLIEDESRVYDCIGYELDILADILIKNDKADIVFTLEKSNFKGIETIQLKLVDIRLRDGRIYRDTEIVQNYFLSLGEKIIKLKDINSCINENDNNIRDFRNSTKRNDALIDKLNSNEKSLILVHTLDGLIEMLFFLADSRREDLFKKIGFNHNIAGKSYIVVNPILETIEIKGYNNIIFYDAPLDINTLKNKKFVGKEVFLLYNKRDIGNLDKLIDRVLPNRNDLADVYKYIRDYEGKEISLIELDKDIKLGNLAKVKLCIYILKDTELINFTQKDSNIYTIDILPMPKEKIDITNTNSYRKIYLIKQQYLEFKEFALDDSLLAHKEN